LLRQLQSAAASAQSASPAAGPRPVLDVPARPLSEQLESFWSPGLSPARLRALTTVPAPAAPDLLLRIFPPPPVPVRGQDLADVLGPAYQRFAAAPEPPAEP
jgi:hypothetical protein